MKNLLIVLLSILTLNCIPDKKAVAKKWHITLLKELPEPITNNAVVEGFMDTEPYVFTFGGLDSTKLHSGIHLRSYRLDVTNNTWKQIADLPDTLGKIASGASRIKNIIYIIGGYHVFKDNSEKSSNKVHRYDILKNRFLEDGTSIPVPIDDHVQAVWRDNLIYVITGWSDKENVSNVQIYNSEINSWSMGTSVPDDHTYKSFGASGTIIGDTIFYFGGASMGKHYPIQNVIRKGIINANDPTQIEWSHQVPDSSSVGYRMAVAKINNKPHWLGGSTATYNYNAIAYDGSGGVNPSNRHLYLLNNKLNVTTLKNLPMDLRGIAEINDSKKIIIGGIEKNQKVSNNAYLLEWRE